MIIEMWEGDHGEAVTLLHKPDSYGGEACPIKVEITDVDDEEVIMYLSVDNFQKLAKTMLRFDELVVAARASTQR